MTAKRYKHWLLPLTFAYVAKLTPMPKADTFRLGENKKIRCPTTDFFARSPVNTPLNAKSGVMDKTGAKKRRSPYAVRLSGVESL